MHGNAGGYAGGQNNLAKRDGGNFSSPPQQQQQAQHMVHHAAAHQQQQQQQILQQQQQLAAQQQAAAAVAQQPQQGTSPCGDSFGLLGLINDKGDTQELQNKFSLIRGFDLAHLGLNLVEPSPLYPTFAAPWNDAATLVIPEYRVPACYKVEVGRITYNTFQKFSEPTCFYVFYSMPKDLLQVAAAKELINRGYVYHTVLKVWIKPDNENKGGWLAFNPEKWATEPLPTIVREEDIMRTVPTTGAQAGHQTASA